MFLRILGIAEDWKKAEQNRLSWGNEALLIGTSPGMPGEYLLVFTLLLWFLFFLIYLGNPENRMNRWCFISGMIYSLGVLKEYLYFSLTPELSRMYPALVTEAFATQVYSVMTAALYYFAFPAQFVFGLYFSHTDRLHPSLFRWLRPLMLVPCLLFGIFYPYIQTRHYQLFDHTYYLLVSAYNLLYGIAFTVLILKTLISERKRPVFRQKLQVAVLFLLPTWYWLITAFVFHSLGLKSLFKVWQGNVVVIAGLLIFFVYGIFHGGIMGFHLNRETYDWNSECRVLNRGAQFTNHFVKNEVAKIEWCADNISRDRENPEQMADIILRSTGHLREFVKKSQRYSEDIAVLRKPCPVQEMLENCVTDFRTAFPKVTFRVHCDGSPVLFCDRSHVEAVLENLVSNAAEAIREDGTVTVAYQERGEGRNRAISVSDTGCGIEEVALASLFEPYRTTKEPGRHFGMGLYYCRNVMRRHGGTIEVLSEPGKGSTFTLHFPEKVRIPGQFMEKRYDLR